MADVRASCAARERGAERRALKAERTGVRGWAAALKVEQAGAEQQLAGRVGGLPSRSGRADGAPAGPRGGAGPRGRRRASWAAGKQAEAGKGKGEEGWAKSGVGLKMRKGIFFKYKSLFLFPNSKQI